jgi:plasmid maintenance system antidote protein VapI
MTTTELIEAASIAAGSQNKLAGLLGLSAPNLVEMKKGLRACTWRVRGRMRVVLGESPEHAFMAAMAEDLAQSENTDEQTAAASFRTMLEAFPEPNGKSPADPEINRASSWRNRRDSNPR